MPGLATAPRVHVPRFRLKGFRFGWGLLPSATEARDVTDGRDDEGDAEGETDPRTGSETDSRTVLVTVRTGDYETTLHVARGTRLRDALLEAGFDVYGPLSRVANCGGRGLCGTCGVCFEDGAASAGDDAGDGDGEVVEIPEPTHWHDRAADRFGYPRLSCQIAVEESLTVRLLEKWMWGHLLPSPSE